MQANRPVAAARKRGFPLLRQVALPLVCLGVVVGCEPSPNNTPTSDDRSVSTEAPPDMVLTNGRIYTLNTAQPQVDALAIRGREIVAAGDSAMVSALAVPSTQTVDLGGRVILPGFHDMHVHPVYAGVQARRCVIPQGSDLATLRTHLQRCVEAAQPGAWITGGQWDDSALGEAPHRRMIDDISPDNPVLLDDTSAHSGWANTRALEIAGINRDTPNPSGGIIARDADGEPTGALHEEANLLVRQHIPGESDAAVRTALEWATGEMLSFGITSFEEAYMGFTTNVWKEARAYADAFDRGALKQRVRLCLPWSPDQPDLEAMIEAREQYRREWLFPDCIKIMLDGVPTQSHTAAMLEPYADTLPGRDDEASRHGILFVAQDALDAATIRFDSMGMTVKFHAAGDAAVRASLQAVRAAREANGNSDLPHNPGHCTFIAQEDLPLARELGATLEFSPYLWSPTPISDDIAIAVGEERAARVWPLREAIDAGPLVVAGSDWSVVPSVNPWIGIETMVTRRAPGGGTRSFGPNEAITVVEAIELYTVNAAIQMGTDDTLGRLEPGMLADLMIVDRDPYEIPATELHQVTVVQTMVGGEFVYGHERVPSGP